LTRGLSKDLEFPDVKPEHVKVKGKAVISGQGRGWNEDPKCIRQSNN